MSPLRFVLPVLLLFAFALVGCTQTASPEPTVLPTIMASPTPSPTVTTSPSLVKDCGSDLQCFVQVAGNCDGDGKALLSLTASAEIFGVKSESTTAYELQGSQDGKCLLRTSIQSYQAELLPEFAASMDATSKAKVEAQLEETARQVRGQYNLCRYPATDFTALLDGLATGNYSYSTADYGRLECTGPLNRLEWDEAKASTAPGVTIRRITPTPSSAAVPSPEASPTRTLKEYSGQGTFSLAVSDAVTLNGYRYVLDAASSSDAQFSVYKDGALVDSFTLLAFESRARYGYLLVLSAFPGSATVRLDSAVPVVPNDNTNVRANATVSTWTSLEGYSLFGAPGSPACALDQCKDVELTLTPGSSTGWTRQDSGIMIKSTSVSPEESGLPAQACFQIGFSNQTLIDYICLQPGQSWSGAGVSFQLKRVERY